MCEAASRLLVQLVQLARALWAIDTPGEYLWRLLVSAALDGTPKARRAVVELLAGASPRTLYRSDNVGDQIGLPTASTRRALEDLAAHGVIERHGAGDGLRWGPLGMAHQPLARTRLSPKGQRHRRHH